MRAFPAAGLLRLPAPVLSDAIVECREGFVGWRAMIENLVLRLWGMLDLRRVQI
jgi:hypothetical protein